MRLQYKDRQTGELKRTKIWCYKFIFAGRLIKGIRENHIQKRLPRKPKKAHRELGEGSNGIVDAPVRSAYRLFADWQNRF